MSDRNPILLKKIRGKASIFFVTTCFASVGPKPVETVQEAQAELELKDAELKACGAGLRFMWVMDHMKVRLDEGADDAGDDDYDC